MVKSEYHVTVNVHFVMQLGKDRLNVADAGLAHTELVPTNCTHFY